MTDSLVLSYYWEGICRAGLKLWYHLANVVQAYSYRLKGKVTIFQVEYRWGAHLPYQGCEPVGGNTTIVCDA